MAEITTNLMCELLKIPWGDYYHVCDNKYVFIEYNSLKIGKIHTFVYFLTLYFHGIYKCIFTYSTLYIRTIDNVAIGLILQYLDAMTRSPLNVRMCPRIRLPHNRTATMPNAVGRTTCATCQVTYLFPSSNLYLIY